MWAAIFSALSSLCSLFKGCIENAVCCKSTCCNIEDEHEPSHQRSRGRTSYAEDTFGTEALRSQKQSVGRINDLDELIAYELSEDTREEEAPTYKARLRSYKAYNLRSRRCHALDGSRHGGRQGKQTASPKSRHSIGASRKPRTRSVTSSPK